MRHRHVWIFFMRVPACEQFKWAKGGEYFALHGCQCGKTKVEKEKLGQ